MPFSTHRNTGFTLLEMMVVLLIIGLLVSLVAPNVMGLGEDAKKVTSKSQIETLTGALDRYKINNDDYPTTDQGLNALVEKPTVDPIPRNWPEDGYLKKKTVPKDPWGRDYLYIRPGTRGKIDVYSQGPNKDSDDDDIGNWD